MAAILKLRRGTTASPSLVDGELFLNYTTGTIQFASGSSISNLLPLDKSVTGNIILSGDVTATNLTLSGDITARDINARNVVLSGDIFLGDGNQSTDNIYVNASFSGSLLPDTTNVYNLGNENYRYKELHVSSAFADTATIQDITLPGSRILSSSLGTYQDFDTFSGSVDTRFEILNSYTQSTDQRLGSIESFTQSIDNRVNTLETTFSSSVDLRLDLLENFSSSEYIADSSSFDSRLDTLEGPFSQSVDLRLDNLEITGSDHENRLDTLETTFSSSVDSRLDSLEFFSSSEYQVDSSSFDNRIQDLTSVTGSYATTGSNTFIGDQTITGSIIGSGSVSFNSIPWPAIGTETHLFKTDPYTVNLSSGDRNYSYLGIALEQILTGSIYENSLLFYTYDDPNNRTYGSETLIGPTRNHMRVLASGSGNLANISVQENGGGNTLGLFYADNIQIGVYTGSSVSIGNQDSDISISGNSLTLSGSVFSFNEITASEFIGDGSKLTHGGTGILSSSVVDFVTYSASVDSRLDTIEGPLSESINQQLDSIHSYTSSLKNAIEVSGQNLTVIGDLLVQGTTTTLNTTDLIVEDKLLAIASGSTTSVQSDGAGFFISGANASFTWNHTDQLLEFNTKVSSSVGFKGDGSELTNIPFEGIVFDGSGIVSGSSQIDLTQTTNYVSGIKNRLNVEGVFSSSVQVNADTVTNFDTNVKDKINQDNVHSGSYLGTATTSNLTEGINLYWTNDRFLTASYQNGFISSSTQLEGVFLEINGDSVVSGSSQIDLTQTTNYISGIKDRLNAETVLSGSQQLTGSLDGRYLKINGDEVISGSDQVTSSLDGRYLEINGDGVVSSSLQIDVNQTQNFTTFSQSADFRLVSLEADQHTHSNKSNLDTIDQNLSSSDTPTFQNLSLTNLNTLSSGELNALFSGSGGTLGIRSLGTSAFYHVSQSIANGDPNVIGNAKAVKDYIDEQLIIIGAGDITAVHAGDGMSGGGLSGSVTLTLDTASAHFTNGVLTSINSFSSSVDSRLDDLEIFSSSLDADFVTQLELANATGALENSIATKLDTGSYNTDSQSFDLRISNQESFSSSIDVTIKTKMNLDGVLSGSSQVLAGSGIVSSSQQISGYGVFAELNGDNLLSSSVDFETYSGSVDGRLVSLETDSHTHLNKSHLDTIDQNLSTTSTVTFANISASNDLRVDGTGSFSSDVTIYGDLTVLGTETIINTSNLVIEDNMIYFNSGSTITNPDLGWAGNYNDGTYAHLGLFADASDNNTFKIYKGYTPEPEGEINTAHASFQLADLDVNNLEVNNITLNGIIPGSGIVSGSSQITKSLQDVTSVGNTTSTTISITNSTSSTSKTTGALVVTGGIGTSGDIFAGGDVVAYASSDERLKDEITPIENSLQKINSIGGYSFVWNEKQNIYKGKDYGVIAQEIENILPELVETRENGYKAVKYDKIVSLLIEGIKELSKEVSELKEKIGK